MADLVLKRCFNHRRREAVARCPNCARFYCRECITEHDGRMLCATCLLQIDNRQAGIRGKIIINNLGRVFFFCCSFFLVWKFFHLIGRILIMVPSSFHEGTVWTGIFKGFG